MNKILNKNKAFANIIFLSTTFILSCFLIVSIMQKQNFIGDNIVFIIILFGLYILQKRFYVPWLATALVCLAIIFHTAGTLGLYGKFVVWVIGYDKLVHIIASFATTFYVFQLIAKKQKIKWIPFAILIMFGLGAIVELSEFIGTRFFGIDNGGLFAIGDELPEVKSDLQKYDTYYDMIFNLVGGLLSVVLILLMRKPYLRHQISQHE